MYLIPDCSLSGGGVAGVVIGVLSAVVALGALMYFLLRRYRRQQASSGTPSSIEKVAPPHTREPSTASSFGATSLDDIDSVNPGTQIIHRPNFTDFRYPRASDSTSEDVDGSIPPSRPMTLRSYPSSRGANEDTSSLASSSFPLRHVSIYLVV